MGIFWSRVLPEGDIVNPIDQSITSSLNSCSGLIDSTYVKFDSEDCRQMNDEPDSIVISAAGIQRARIDNLLKDPSPLLGEVQQFDSEATYLSEIARTRRSLAILRVELQRATHAIFVALHDSRMFTLEKARRRLDTTSWRKDAIDCVETWLQSQESYSAKKSRLSEISAQSHLLPEPFSVQQMQMEGREKSEMCASQARMIEAEQGVMTMFDLTKQLSTVEELQKAGDEREERRKFKSEPDTSHPTSPEDGVAPFRSQSREADTNRSSESFGRE